MEFNAELFQLFRHAVICPYQLIAFPFDTLPDSLHERLSEIFRDPFPCFVRHEQEDIRKGMLRIRHVLCNDIIS